MKMDELDNPPEEPLDMDDDSDDVELPEDFGGI